MFADIHISSISDPFTLSRNKSYIDVNDAAESNEYYMNDPLYAQPREEGPVARYQATGLELKSPQLNTEDDDHDYEDI